MFFSNKTEELKEEIEQKEEKIQKLEEEKESLRKQLESSDEKRRKLAKEKQEAEEKLNRLKDKLESEKEQSEEQKEEKTSFRKLGFSKAEELVEKLDSIEGEELVTVYSHGGVSEDNLVSKKVLEEVNRYDDFILFTDNGLFDYLIRTRPFYSEEAGSSEEFDLSQLRDFIQEEKTWITVSAGEAHFYDESNGDVNQIEELKNRIEKKHGKGGFSQGRFERKRKQQIEGFRELVEEKIEELEPENVYLVGEKRICKEIERGEYLGGFDDNQKTVNALYQFRFKKLLTSQ
jgi:predicted  nucleic acid-binding Zn-ribbon protein